MANMAKLNGYDIVDNIARNGVTTAGTGAAYTATVPGITSLKAGANFVMIPNVVSTTTAPTLNVNGLGAKTIRRRISNSTSSTVAGQANNWLAANKPVGVTYDGSYWIVDFTQPNASDIYGTVPVANGGTGGTTAAAARTNLGITPANIGAAAASHNHGLLHDNLTVNLANTTTDSGWSMINSSYTNGHLLKSIRTQGSAPVWTLGNYASGIAFGGSDTKGVMTVAYGSPIVKFAGGNGTKPVWNMSITGTSGASYNLASFMRGTNANGYWGITNPDGSTSGWTRTTSSGIIPYNSGGASALGTSSWPFTNIYGTNIYGSGNNRVYAAKVLYSNNSGTTGTVTLNETAANFTFIEIYYCKQGAWNGCGCTKLISPQAKAASLIIAQLCDDNSTRQMTTASAYVYGTNITRVGANFYFNSVENNQIVWGDEGTSNAIHIRQVVGYK